MHLDVADVDEDVGGSVGGGRSLGGGLGHGWLPTGLWQRRARDPDSSNRGLCEVHASTGCEQRGAKAQAWSHGRLSDDGAGDGGELLAARGVEPRDGAEQAGGVRVPRAGEQLVALAPLHDPPRVEDVDLVTEAGDDPEVVGDHDERGVGALDELLEQGEDLRLDRDVEGGRRLVGDEQTGLAGQGHRDEGALAHPAAHLVGVVLETAVGVGDADPLEQVPGDRHGGLARHLLVPLQDLGDLAADRDDRVQRGERVLEDHRDVAAAAVAQVGVGEPEQVGSLEERLALDRVPAAGEQPHDRERGDRLPAAGLADEADGLAGPDVEADAVDGRERVLALAPEGHPQVAHDQQRLLTAGGGAVAGGGGRGHLPHLLVFGSRASRSDSPIRVKPSATVMMQRAGYTASEGWS